MTWIRERHRRAGAWLVAVAWVVSLVPASAQPRAGAPVKPSLVEALQSLQAKGLRIVFSSEVVDVGLRVLDEPRTPSARQQLDELLQPHGLMAKNGPGGVIQIVRRPRVSKDTPVSAPRSGVTEPGSAVPADRESNVPLLLGHREQVTVNAPPFAPRVPGVGAETTASGSELREQQSVLADDPVRSAQAWPRVAATDDFRGEFSVRGGQPRHVAVVIDGVATPWLQHAVHGANSGSLGMLSSDVLDGATLHTGAYPRRETDTLGAQLTFDLREGSRSSTRFGGLMSGINASLLGEGPIGGQRRGSWLVNVRQSYREWPRDEFGGTPFGFADAQAKVVYDVGRGQRFSASLLGGRSLADERGERRPEELATGTNGAGVLNIAWRSMVGADVVLTQRAYVAGHRFLNVSEAGHEWSQGRNGEVAYRADLLRTLGAGTLEAGTHVSRSKASRQDPSAATAERPDEGKATNASPRVLGSWAQRSGYVHVTWAASPHLTLASGVRLADSTLVNERIASRWVLTDWALGSQWKLRASTGVSHQFPGFEHVGVNDATRRVRPERARHVDVGLERRLSPSIRLQATLFHRQEQHLLHPLHVVPVEASQSQQPSLSGASQGAELLVERRSRTGLSGWIGYSYGTARYRDVETGASAWADFDQRHSVTTAGAFRLSDRTSVSAQFRAGTNFPAGGEWVPRERGSVAAPRSDARLTPYARLDVRASRALVRGEQRLTLFVEVLNVLDRNNQGHSPQFVQGGGDSSGGVDGRYFPRRPSAGLRVEF